MYLGPSTKDLQGLSITRDEYELLIDRGYRLIVKRIIPERMTVHVELVRPKQSASGGGELLRGESALPVA
jgi:hypothetical protein